MARYTPFAQGDTLKRFRAQGRGIQDGVFSILKSGEHPSELERMKMKVRVLGKLDKLLGTTIAPKDVQQLLDIVGISDSMLPEESIQYGARMAAQLRWKSKKAIAFALWSARLHNTATNVYGKPEWLKKFEGKVSPKRRLSRLNLFRLHEMFADHRIGMFERAFKPANGIVLSRDYDMLVDRIIGKYEHPDSQFLGEMQVKEILDSARPHKRKIVELQELKRLRKEIEDQRKLEEREGEYKRAKQRIRKILGDLDKLRARHADKFHWIDPDAL